MQNVVIHILYLYKLLTTILLPWIKCKIKYFEIGRKNR